MGQSLISLSSWKEIYENECVGHGLTDNADEVTVRSISSFDRNEGEMVYRTVSFKRNDSETNLKFNAPEEIIIEETTSLNNSKSEKRRLNTTVSFKDLVLDTEKTNSPNTSKNNIDHNMMHESKLTLSEPAVMFSPRPVSELDAAAVKLQKVYKSYRTRRNLADCAVVVEELWWKALDFAALKRSSVSFFNIEKPETAVSRWARARTRAAKVGKGLSKDEKAQKLALQHWLEAIDPRHRYGHNLHLYYDIWFDSESNQPFFYWLDVGDGKEVNLERCSRNDLLRNCIKYLGPKEREAYEVIVDSGNLVYKQSGMLVNTIEGSKWIFVLSTSRSLYVGQKKKGLFQHSSFLSGAATTAAGRLVAHNGILEAIWPYSGHYLPTEENFKEFISFLRDHYVDLTNVKRCATDDDCTPIKLNEVETKSGAVEASTITAASAEDKKTNAGEVNVQSPKTASTVHHHRDDMETKAKNVDISTVDMGRRLKCDWSTGAGPRISCVRDYPTELQARALEQVNLSPRVMSGVIWNNGPIPSPRPSPKVRLSPRLAYIGLPSPKVRLSPGLTYMGLPSPRVSIPTAK